MTFGTWKGLDRTGTFRILSARRASLGECNDEPDQNVGNRAENQWRYIGHAYIGPGHHKAGSAWSIGRGASLKPAPAPSNFLMTAK
jgi:hypothetical protein